MKRKKILVTGGSGVIGRELLFRLNDLHNDVLSVDKIPPTVDFLPDNTTFIKLNIALDDLKDIVAFNPEVIFHLAASFERSAESAEFWDTNWLDNTLLSHRIVEILRKCSSIQKFIFASSYLIYDPALYLKGESIGFLKEKDYVSPRNLTGAAKYYTEKELAFMKEYVRPDVDIVNARIFRVYGCGSKDVVSRWVRDCLTNKEIELFNKENIFDFIYAGDVAEGLVRLSEVSNFTGCVNLGFGRGNSIADVIDVINNNLPCKVNDSGTIINVEKSVADLTLLKRLTDWNPSTTLQEGIGKVIVYERG
ncbi:MAG: NAD(P)-dependent oxidoreductase [Candidatus Magnetoovum sp. WYHC-5]|nr:NAD(P)-dependent oxidoreductase [Candidatus Magnetoovum sp. WYHC-5]